jgi:hypothetical protein
MSKWARSMRPLAQELYPLMRICRMWYCFARYSIAETKAGPLSVTISDREPHQQMISLKIQLPRVVADSEHSL